MRRLKSLITIAFASILMLGSLLVIFLYSEEDTLKKKWDVNTHDRTNFPLVGKHRTVSCGECHLKGVLQGTPTNCEACHWIRKKDDRYNLQLGIHCGDCHTPLDWKLIRPGAWVHEQKTGFPLTGSHKTLDCDQCHKSNILGGLPDDCFSCHEADYNNASSPNHLTAQFPTDCSLCHTSTHWNATNYSHPGFPLNGSHLSAPCSDCHQNGVYAGTPNQCAACHMDDYNQARDPNHLEGGFSTSCEICHGFDAVSWEGAIFDHNLVWPLQGAHQNLDCAECHANGYNLPQNCYGCHQAEYQATSDPNHISAGFPTQCESCHFPNHLTWSQAVFNHNFPINSGEHAGYACTDCHLTANYNVFSCIDCHAHRESRMNGIHNHVVGYIYSSQACYSCHPQGIK